MDKKKIKEILFPYSKVRKIQDELLLKVDETIKEKGSAIIHAPTGIGKTSVLGPALAHAIKKKLTVFFLSSRHTHHTLAINVLKKIRERYNKKFVTVDIIGKKWMCPVPGTDILYSGEFTEYCKKQREDGLCKFYNNTKKKNKLTVKAKQIINELKIINPHHNEECIKICSKEDLCPYEISLELAKVAQVIIGDYFYLFSTNVRDTFFTKTKKTLDNSIIIVDEAHNLPTRVRELMTVKLSNFILDRAIKEAKKFKFQKVREFLVQILRTIKGYSNNLAIGQEILISKADFTKKIESIMDYDELASELSFAGDEIREKQKKSYVGSVASFLDAWTGEDEGFARIFSVTMSKHKTITLSYRCLDPSLITRQIINDSYSVICMSGTLTPTSMYNDVLGFHDAKQLEYDSPFPKKNRLSLVIPETTTKYSARSQAQYKNIAKICANIANMVPGNSAIFFPSYNLRDEINKYFRDICKKTTFAETPRLNKVEKKEFLDNFKKYKKSGAVLLGVASGSFGEGVDLPGDLLKCVVVVGLPLNPPDLEVKELIKYYDEKFKKGWDYGYTLPAITKSLQNAGRCIRTEKDKGVIIFLDERYAWSNYKKCFPIDWDVKVTKMYEERILDFFK